MTDSGVTNDALDQKWATVRAANARKGDYVFITPVANVTLTDAVNNEFSINRVLFVNGRKLPRIWKRLGIHTPYSEIRKSSGKTYLDLLDEAKTFAVIFQKESWDGILVSSYRLIRDEISILALSQLGYAKRRFMSNISIMGEHGVPRISYAVFSRDSSFKGRGGRLTGNPGELILNNTWKDFQRHGFFSKLLRILQGRSPVKSEWRRDLYRASTLVGQSINSNDVPTSFLWNMIALELLLTREGDKFSDALPKRAEAFLGWVGYWSSKNYEARIREVYRKRCDFVHRGDREAITKADLLFTDDLLFNLLLNLVYYSGRFNSKQSIIDFSDKVEAEHTLGISSKVRPKRLRYFSHTYTKDDLREM
jgi:hypothetical protein